MLTIGKLWKYIGHTIVPYNTTIQGYCTIKLQSLDTYHPILSLTHMLAILFYDALYGRIVWCYWMVVFHSFM